MCPFHEQNCFHIKHLHKISVCLGGPRHKNPIARENQDLKLSVCYRWFASRETKIGELETAHILRLLLSSAVLEALRMSPE